MDKPERITLSKEEAEALKARIGAVVALSENDKKIMLGLISFTLWLQHQLEGAKLTIKRLCQLFGTSTEKRSQKKSPLKQRK